MSSTSPRDALRKAEIRITSTMAMIFGLRMFGLFLLLPVFSLLGGELSGATPLLIGTAIGAYGLLQAFLQIPFGMLSDRFGRRPLILAGLVLFTVGGVVAALSDHIYGVILGRALQGAGAIASVIMALVSDSVSDDRRTRAMALIGMSVGGAFVLALIVGPLAARSLGLSGLFWAISVMGAIALLVAWFRVPRSKNLHAHAAMRSPLSLLQLFRHSDLWRLNLSIFSLHLVMTATFVVLPLVLRQQVGLTLEAHSLLYLLVMLGGVVGMVPLIIYADKRRVRPVMLAGIAMLIAAEALLAVSGSALWQHIVALLIFFTAFNLLEALLPSLVGRAVPAGTRGAAMGIYSSSQFFGVFVGGQLGGWLLGSNGSAGAFWLCVGMLAVWLLCALSFRELPRLESRIIQMDEGVQSGARLQELLSLEGVVEGLLVPEDGIAVLKVDPAILDEDLLKQWLAGSAQAV
ncbi:MAG: MFS transporter [Alcanivoracaceae bacterium]|nr:MFS transporter [Alcanivoracaceae bacterium]